MKTAKQILFERHRGAEPALDAVRQKALAAVSGAATAKSRGDAGPDARPFLREVWLQLVWPSRRAWSGMAAVWVILLVANLGMKATGPGASLARSSQGQPLAQAVEEQRRLLAELLPPPSPPALAPAAQRERPRSQGPTDFKSC